MSQNRLASLSLAILIGLASLLVAQPVLACSVCYGDPNSAMTLGAQAGVLVMLGVVGTVLMGLASMLIFWMRRAAQLQAQAEAVEAASEAAPSAARTPFSHA